MKQMSAQEHYQFSRSERAVEYDPNVIDLVRIAKVVWRRRLQFSAVVILGVACAVGAYAELPARWRASATLQIGQMQATSTSREATLIEPAVQFVEKFKLLDDSVFRQADGRLDPQSDDSGKLMASTLKAALVKNTALIQVSVAGYTPDEARRNIEIVTEVVIAEHAALLAPTVRRLREQLQDNAIQLEKASMAKKKTQDLLGGTGRDAQFAPTLLAMQMIESKDAEIRRLTAERLVLEDLASPTKTFVTKIVGDAQVEGSPYFPNLKLLLALGLFLGALLGGCLVLYLEWRSGVGSSEAR
jgi:capsular polysaccharide biosynthesis protein